MIRPKALGE